MPSIDEPQVKAIHALRIALDELGVEPVIIGGVAVSLLAVPRYTEDLDAMILMDIADAPKLLDVLESHGFVPRFRDMIEAAIHLRLVTLRHTLSNTTVDLALGCLPFEEELVHRATIHSDNDFEVCLPTPEDLIILKAIANREKDRMDIRSIAEVYPRIDRSRIRHWVEEFGEVTERPELWSEIEPLLNPE